MLRVLVVDDELPAREELAYLLRLDERIGEILTAESGADALRALEREPVDAIFLDIRMPGLTGIELARVLARFTHAPAVVFVTAYDEHAVDAFELEVVDYLLKPVRPERLTEAIRRVVERANGTAARREPADAETIPVELGGVTRFVPRSEVRYVEAHGDYARLHTGDASHLVRASLATLADQWQEAGFVRIHRRLLVALPYVSEVRFDAGRCVVQVGDAELQVSRRHTAQLRELLVRRARPGRGDGR
ncbi:LytTR family DNA-binding domain-containing protein [Actinopolymorpha sp. B17G11]|uniref:LytR/AlgR family response regulator transcription factor n=1 Tax=unclassified Actinopolymorpha TaxID=2627063 RepID=UPI0032D962F7